MVLLTAESVHVNFYSCIYCVSCYCAIISLIISYIVCACAKWQKVACIIIPLILCVTTQPNYYHIENDAPQPSSNDKYCEHVNFLTAPAVRYLVSVEAGSGSGCDPPVIVECYTVEGQPPVVTGVWAQRLNGTAMNVSWTPLNEAQAGGFIEHYIITYTMSTRGRVTQSVSVPAHKTSAVVGRLDPASGYDVTVGALSRGGTSQGSGYMSLCGYIISINCVII